jgi:hypothetical protein
VRTGIEDCGGYQRIVGAIQNYVPLRHALKALFHQGEELLYFPQNLVEFWNASTRPPKANGLGFSPEQGGPIRRSLSDAFATRP